MLLANTCWHSKRNFAIHINSCNITKLNRHSVKGELFAALNLSNYFIYSSFFSSVKQFGALVRKLDVNLDTISTKVNSALTRLEKKYDVMLALYQRFEK